jgi:hypothetical protein
MNTGPWSLHVLSEVLAAFTVESPSALRDVLSRVSEAVDAEVTAIFADDDYVLCTGLDEDDKQLLRTSCTVRPHDLSCRSGLLHLYWSSLGGVEWLVVGRFSEIFSMEERALPPVLVLISDGQPTDDFESGLARLMTNPWAQKAVRLSIAIGHEADLDVLQQFIGSPLATTTEESMLLRPLQASNASSLAHYIEWAATTVVGATSQPISMLEGRDCWGNVGIVEILPTTFTKNDVMAETVIW